MHWLSLASLLLSSGAEARPGVWYEPGPIKYEVSPSNAQAAGLETEDVLRILFARSFYRGMELDTWVHVGERRFPTTILVGADRSVSIDLHEASAVLVSPVAGITVDEWSAQLVQQYGIAGFVNGTANWTVAEVALVDQAFAFLSAEEIVALEGMELRRQRVGRSMGDVASYDPARVVPRIELFDLAVEVDEWNFVGDPSAPLPTSLLAIVHEVGHAISDAPRRRLHREWDVLATQAITETEAERDAGRRARRQLRLRSRQLGAKGPVIIAFQEVVRGGERAPTLYGRRDPHEAFAEAFGLYHTDPKALLRVMPAAHAWFANQGHIQAWHAWDSANP